MFRRWLASHRSLFVTATSASLIGAVVAGLAVVSGGYDAQRIDLGDGSVWVANSSEQVIGRANTEILALDTVVEGSGSELDVIQAGRTVLLFDRANSKVDIVDAATAEVSDSVPLPPEGPELHLAGDTVVIHATRTGAVWLVPVGDLRDFDAEAEPTLSLGSDSAVSVSPDGTLLLFSPDAGEVYRVDAATGDSVEEAFPADFAESGSDISISSVAGRWVLLDASSSRLSIEGRMLDLSELLDGSRNAVLQSPSTTGDRVLIGFPGGLLSVPLAEGDPTVVADSDGGIPAAPLVLGDCVFAAWTSGTAWRECAGDSAPTELALESVGRSAARVAFAVNGDRVMLSDPRNGSSWAVQQRGELIDNWDELIAEDEERQEVEENNDDVPPEYETNQLPPIAIEDEFGARAGRANVLPALLNDYDPNGDVLVVETVGQIEEGIGRLDVIDSRQRIQLTLLEDVTGTVSFDYTISDGRGGTAAATVTVTVRSPGENSSPVQVRPTRALVAEGNRVTTPVLGDWIDPDSDAFYLTSASTAPPDVVTYKPSGAVDFQEGGASSQLRAVSLTVSDGEAIGAGSLTVSVRPAGEVPIIADPFVVISYAGQETTVRPLEHVRGGTGELRLSSVAPRPGATIEASLETGTFRFTSDQVRSHNLEYVVNDGDQTVTGTVRIDVQARPDANSTPITIPKTVFVKTLSSETVDVASTDIDPAGGVLLVTGVSNVPDGSGVSADVLEQRYVRMTLTAPLEGTVAFDYRVTNGLAGADGVITVVEIPRPTTLQPPVAADDTVTVRMGDSVDIPVLDNDAHPDGEQLTLNPELPSGLRSASGLLFASGDVLRYLAPERSGNFTAVYEVAGPDGQVDQAEVRIAVRESVAATNSAPVPGPVTARVLAGETVRIKIPLTGIDPDGDSVQLLGQDTSPQKGAVTGVGSDYIDYLAGEYSAGTDTFTYRVIDSLGKRAIGTVRVGISPRSGDAGNPIAVEDEVLIRPGKTVSVQVLANDSDPDGSPLTILSVEPNSPDIVFEVVDDIVRVTPPSDPGRYGLVYTIENAYGGTSSNFITVVVDPDAPPAYPVARDTVLTLSDIADRDTVNVDVLRNVFFADGNVSSLELSLLPGFGDTATVQGKRLDITITDRRQIIPFSVANPDDPTIVAYAFVWVPGFDDALPQLDRTARTLTVVSESRIEFDLNDYVLAVEGRRVRLVDSTTVQATNSNGDSLAVDEDTLSFTSADGYFGPASISFEVTDGSSIDDPDGRRATLVLPIRVTPRENQPPVFTGGTIDFEPGEEKTLDLLRLTTYPYLDDIDELVYSAGPTPPSGFDYEIRGTSLIIRANEGTQKGTSTGLTIGVRDDLAEGQSGRIQLSVVASTRPLAKPAADTVIAQRGTTTTIDVLANDQATNPFPGGELTVVAITGLDGSTLPEGITVAPNATRTRLSVTVSATAAPIDTNLQYQVADATREPGRYAFGSVTISVQDRPDTPIAPARADGGYEEGLVTLRLTPPPSNNSPIVKYEVVSTSHGSYRKDCGTEQRCELTDLQPGLRYRFSVIATNSVGASDASPESAALTADYLPAAPRSVSARATAADARPALDVAWSPVADPALGTPVSGYVVRISGPDVDFQTTTGPESATLTTTAGGALSPGSQYSVTVYARNAAAVLSDADWRRTSSAAVTVVGEPSQVSVAADVVNGSSGQIRVTWGAANPNGAPGVVYSVGRFDADADIPSTCGPGGPNPGVSSGAPAPAASGWIDGSATDGTDYRYVVYVDNGLFCTPSASGAVQSKAPPGATLASTAVEQRDGKFDLRVTSLSASSGIASRFQAQLNGSGIWFPVEEGSWLTSAANLAVYGAPQSVLYRACRDSTEFFCGAASAAEVLTPVNVRGSIVSCEAGSIPTSNPPANQGSPTYQYLYAYDDGGPPFERWSAFELDAVAPDPSAVGSGVTGVRLKVVVSLSDGSTYTDDGYVQAACSPRP